MFGFNSKEKPLDLADEALVKAFSELEVHSSDTREYAQILEKIETLSKVRASMKPDSTMKAAILSISGVLLNTGLMMRFEKAGHIFSSKALGFAPKIKS